MLKKKITILVLVLAVMTVISGCWKKKKPIVENYNQQKSYEQKIENIADTAKDINISDWEVYQNKEYGFEVRYPKEWKDIKEKVEEISYVHPKSLVLNFNNFSEKKISKNFINNYIKFITNKSYNEYIKKNVPSFYKGRYETLESIYKNRSIIDYNIDQYNAGSASYILFKEKPFVSKYIESNKQKSVILKTITKQIGVLNQIN